MSSRSSTRELSGSVFRVAIGGGQIETLATDQPLPRAVHVTPEGVYFIAVGHPGVDCTPTDSSMTFLPASGLGAMVLLSNLDGATSLAVASDGTAYLTVDGSGCNDNNPHGGSLLKLTSGSSTAQTLVSGLRGPDRVFVDEANVYFTTSSDAGDGSVIPRAVLR